MKGLFDEYKGELSGKPKSEKLILENCYKVVTDRFLEALKSENKNWTKPFADAAQGLAYSYSTKKPYKGFINQVLCMEFATDKEPYFLTKEAIKKAGGKLTKKHISTTLIFFKNAKIKREIEDDKGNKKTTNIIVPVLRSYEVYHQSFVEGINFPTFKSPTVFENEQIATAQTIIDNMPKKPKITELNKGAYYMPSSDTVNMPEMKYFISSQNYYATFFHELVHSTKDSKRLGARKLQRFVRNEKGDAAYSFEELIAEIGSTLLCADAGILNFTFENSVAYTQGWKSRYFSLVKNHEKAVYDAITEAIKAAKYINEKQYNVLSNIVAPELEKDENELAIEFMSEFANKPKNETYVQQKRRLNKVHKNIQTAIQKGLLTKSNKYKKDINEICDSIEKFMSYKRERALVYKNMPTLKRKLKNKGQAQVTQLSFI